MNNTILRSMITGAFSAAAALSLLAVTDTAHAAPAECAPIYLETADGSVAIAYPDFCDEGPVVPGPVPFIPILPIDELPLIPLTPIECKPLDLANLEVRAAQTSPDNWQWLFWINGDTDNLCNDWVQTEMVDNDTGLAATQSFSIWNIVDVNDEGADYRSEYVTPCRYDTRVHFGEEYTVLDEYTGQEKFTDACVEDDTPVDEGTPDTPEVPGDQGTPDTTPDTAPDTTPDTTPDTPKTPDQPETPQTPRTPGDQDLPSTGSDSTTLIVGLGMVVIGAGLGFTAMSMTRRRRAA